MKTTISIEPINPLLGDEKIFFEENISSKILFDQAKLRTWIKQFSKLRDRMKVDPPNTTYVVNLAIHEHPGYLRHINFVLSNSGIK